MLEPNLQTKRRRNPRHMPPAVRYPLVLPRVVMWGVVGYIVVGVIALMVWSFWGTGALDYRVILGIWIVWFVLAGYAVWHLRSHPRGVLRFDAGQWRWQTLRRETTRVLTNPYMPIDFQHLILVRFENEIDDRVFSPLFRLMPRPVIYIWLSRSTQPDQWPALRRALWSARSSTSA